MPQSTSACPVFSFLSSSSISNMGNLSSSTALETSLPDSYSISLFPLSFFSFLGTRNFLGTSFFTILDPNLPLLLPLILYSETSRTSEEQSSTISDATSPLTERI
ncbi:hypothetical protein V8G54_034566 [Vigna mungo]|uniref:Uncharacterized protein n=1 Tax=Vigna mungo TaxID=3915 RepID=A0AAQ3RHE8_VIGMU